LEANNIALTQRITQLDLYHLQQLPGAIGQSVYLPQGNVTVLCRAQVKRTVIQCDVGYALDDNPVLDAVVVFLQADLLSRQYADALDLAAS
jgi:hypothetical protein